MEFKNDDIEMARIYNESLHPKDYKEDSKFGKHQRRNLFKQDVQSSKSNYTTNKKSVNNNADDTKTVMSVLTILGLVLLILLFILLPIIIVN